MKTNSEEEFFTSQSPAGGGLGEFWTNEMLHFLLLLSNELCEASIVKKSAEVPGWRFTASLSLVLLGLRLYLLTLTETQMIVKPGKNNMSLSNTY